MRRVRRRGSCGMYLIVFGLGLIFARCIPIQLLLVVVAVVLVLSGWSICRNHF